MEDLIEVFKETYQDSFLNDKEIRQLFEKFNGEYHMVVEYYEEHFVDQSQKENNQVQHMKDSFSQDSNFDFVDREKKRSMNAFEFLEHNKRQHEKAARFLKEKSRQLRMTSEDYLKYPQERSGTSFLEQNKNLDQRDFMEKLKAQNDRKGRTSKILEPNDMQFNVKEQSGVLVNFQRHKGAVEDLLRETNKKYNLMNKEIFDGHKESWVEEFFSRAVGNTLDIEQSQLGLGGFDGLRKSTPVQKEEKDYAFLRLGTFVLEETCMERNMITAPDGCLLEVFLEDNIHFQGSETTNKGKRNKKNQELPGRIYLKYRNKKIISLKNKNCREMFLLLRKNFIKIAPWVVSADANLL
jgi:hypothetical protein